MVTYKNEVLKFQLTFYNKYAYWYVVHPSIMSLKLLDMSWKNVYELIF